MKSELEHPISLAFSPVVIGICRFPKVLKIWEKVHPGGMFELRFTPHMADIRLLIGKGGRQSKAFRYLGQIMGKLRGHNVDVQFEESWIGDRDEQIDLKFNPDFELSHFVDLIKPVTLLTFGRHILVEGRIEDGKFQVALDCLHGEIPMVMAINDIFFPLGRANGRKTEVKPKGFRIFDDGTFAKLS